MNNPDLSAPFRNSYAEYQNILFRRCPYSQLLDKYRNGWPDAAGIPNRFPHTAEATLG